MIAFAIWRILVRAPVPDSDKNPFQITLPARAATPETAALAGGADEDGELGSLDPRQAEGAPVEHTDPTPSAPEPESR